MLAMLMSLMHLAALEHTEPTNHNTEKGKLITLMDVKYFSCKFYIFIFTFLFINIHDAISLLKSIP